VSLGPVYGEILAGQFLEMWRALGGPPEFSLLEQGANDGRLAGDILDALAGTPLEGVRLNIVEPHAALREVQRDRLCSRNVRWFHRLEDLPEICGVHFSNELFDAFPVHVVRSTGESWVELRVDFKEGRFVWKEASPGFGLAGKLSLFPKRPSGFTTEIGTGYQDFFRILSEKISRGFLLAVDYGLTTSALLEEHRREGTLRCYRNHRPDSRPLDEPGRKDITAHVNFSLLAGGADRAGWRLEKFTDQHHFLVGAATQMLRELDGTANSPKLRSLTSLLHPENMVRQFQASLFSRGVAPGTELSGFRYARDSDLPN
jgi:SAM-dependent MidA family methyltransferase